MMTLKRNRDGERSDEPERFEVTIPVEQLAGGNQLEYHFSCLIGSELILRYDSLPAERRKFRVPIIKGS